MLKEYRQNEKEGTGYPSIDRPWIQFYSKEALENDIPNMKIYDYIRDLLKNHLESNCFEYFGNRITCKKFLTLTEKTARAFKYLAVKRGDIVSIISPTTPEAIFCVYGLNRIGAIANLIDPRLSIENIREKTADSKIIVCIDLIRDKIEQAASKKQLIIYYSISESFPWYLSLGYGVKRGFKKGEEKFVGKRLSWKDFLKKATTINRVIDTAYQSNEVVVIVSTSGTTGKSKLAQLTNENINAVAWQYEYSGISHRLGDTFLNVMPIFLSYGVVTGIHMPLALGFKSVIIPQRELSKVGTYLLKYKPQAYQDIPAALEALIGDEKRFQNVDLSFLNNLGVGGDHLSENLEGRINDFLKKHKKDILVQKGYGMTEISSAAIVNVSKACNSIGSVGVPLPKTIAKIVDPNTGKELGYDEVGELYLSSPAVFAGYFKDQKATEYEVEIDSEKRRWVHTGDLFSMNERGELFFHERMKAMFVRPDGHNNHPNTMNELILKHPAVLDACTVGVSSPYHTHGKYPKSVIVLKDEYKGKEKEIQKELEDMCIREFSQRDVPYYYEFKEAIPFTPNGKVDFRRLEDEGIEHASEAEVLRRERATAR